MSNGPTFEARPGWGGQLGGWLRNNMVYVIPAVAIVILVAIIMVSGGNSPELVETSSSPSSSPLLSGSANMETVLARDSYTLVARRIVSTRADNVSNGARLYAETKLAQDLKAQPLVIGNKISYDPASVDAYLIGFNDLYPTQKAKWEAMAKNIKF